MRREQAQAIGVGVLVVTMSVVALCSPVLLGFVIGRWTA